MESAPGNAWSEWSVRVVLYLHPLIAQSLVPRIDKLACRFHLCDHELYRMRCAVCACHDIRHHPNAPLGCGRGVLPVRLVWSLSAWRMSRQSQQECHVLMEITAWIERQLCRTHRGYRRRRRHVFPQPRKGPLALIGSIEKTPTCILLFSVVRIHEQSRCPAWSSLLALL